MPLLTFDRDAIERSGYATTRRFHRQPAAKRQEWRQQRRRRTHRTTASATSRTPPPRICAASAQLHPDPASTDIASPPLSYGTGVDLSMIPLSAVERIEVLTDGSSAVYGSDAVGGVINIILRKDFNGQESSVCGSTRLSRGGGELKQLGQSVGRTWGTGGALAVLQFEDANAIHADQRSFTANLPQPTDIYPAIQALLRRFQRASKPALGSLDLFADALLEHHDGFRALHHGRRLLPSGTLTTKTDATSANAGLRWQPFGDWHLEATRCSARYTPPPSKYFSPPQFGYTNGTPYFRNLDHPQRRRLETGWHAVGLRQLQHQSRHRRFLPQRSLLLARTRQRYRPCGGSSRARRLRRNLRPPDQARERPPRRQKARILRRGSQRLLLRLRRQDQPTLRRVLVTLRSTRIPRRLQHLVPRARPQRIWSPTSPSTMSLSKAVTRFPAATPAT